MIFSLNVMFVGHDGCNRPISCVEPPSVSRSLVTSAPLAHEGSALALATPKLYCCNVRSVKYPKTITEYTITETTQFFARCAEFEPSRTEYKNRGRMCPKVTKVELKCIPNRPTSCRIHSESIKNLSESCCRGAVGPNIRRAS